eukprot:NODE_82_length_3897_cov_36.346052_g70_i0.p1 GENE.NODE_82_length_3897_cov_36.346052_g70_i0~~NODE_82_length_3897_cov_36.346052_g70_i0.p1  ORF type:complete len:1256 (+),score=181.47 NODE_82_length_3897_cov_36.346052_g70_i0:73-3840(+)
MDTAKRALRNVLFYRFDDVNPRLVSPNPSLLMDHSILKERLEIDDLRFSGPLFWNLQEDIDVTDNGLYKTKLYREFLESYKPKFRYSLFSVPLLILLLISLSILLALSWAQISTILKDVQPIAIQVNSVTERDLAFPLFPLRIAHGTIGFLLSFAMLIILWSGVGDVALRVIALLLFLGTVVAIVSLAFGLSKSSNISDHFGPFSSPTFYNVVCCTVDAVMIITLLTCCYSAWMCGCSLSYSKVEKISGAMYSGSSLRPQDFRHYEGQKSKRNRKRSEQKGWRLNKKQTMLIQHIRSTRDNKSLLHYLVRPTRWQMFTHILPVINMRVQALRDYFSLVRLNVWASVIATMIVSLIVVVLDVLFWGSVLNHQYKIDDRNHQTIYYGLPNDNNILRLIFAGLGFGLALVHLFSTFERPLLVYFIFTLHVILAGALCWPVALDLKYVIRGQNDWCNNSTQKSDTTFIGNSNNICENLPYAAILGMGALSVLITLAFVIVELVMRIWNGCPFCGNVFPLMRHSDHVNSCALRPVLSILDGIQMTTIDFVFLHQSTATPGQPHYVKVRRLRCKQQQALAGSDISPKLFPTLSSIQYPYTEREVMVGPNPLYKRTQVVATIMYTPSHFPFEVNLRMAIAEVCSQRFNTNINVDDITILYTTEYTGTSFISTFEVIGLGHITSACLEDCLVRSNHSIRFKYIPKEVLRTCRDELDPRTTQILKEVALISRYPKINHMWNMSLEEITNDILRYFKDTLQTRLKSKSPAYCELNEIYNHLQMRSTSETGLVHPRLEMATKNYYSNAVGINPLMIESLLVLYPNVSRMLFKVNGFIYKLEELWNFFYRHDNRISALDYISLVAFLGYTILEKDLINMIIHFYIQCDDSQMEAVKEAWRIITQVQYIFGKFVKMKWRQVISILDSQNLTLTADPMELPDFFGHPSDFITYIKSSRTELPKSALEDHLDEWFRAMASDPSGAMNFDDFMVFCFTFGYDVSVELLWDELTEIGLVIRNKLTDDRFRELLISCLIHTKRIQFPLHYSRLQDYMMIKQPSFAEEFADRFKYVNGYLTFNGYLIAKVLITISTLVFYGGLIAQWVDIIRLYLTSQSELWVIPSKLVVAITHILVFVIFGDLLFGLRLPEWLLATILNISRPMARMHHLSLAPLRLTYYYITGKGIPPMIGLVPGHPVYYNSCYFLLGTRLPNLAVYMIVIVNSGQIPQNIWLIFAVIGLSINGPMVVITGQIVQNHMRSSEMDQVHRSFMI